MKLIYVAGAYSGDTEKNIAEAEAVSIALIRQGFFVITPHKNTSGYEKYEDGKITYDTWLKMDLEILSRCDVVYVMKNSTNSNGTKTEIKHAQKLGIPIIYEKDCPPDSIESCPVCGFPMVELDAWDCECKSCGYKEQGEYVI